MDTKDMTLNDKFNMLSKGLMKAGLGLLGLLITIPILAILIGLLIAIIHVAVK